MNLFRIVEWNKYPKHSKNATCSKKYNKKQARARE